MQVIQCAHPGFGLGGGREGFLFFAEHTEHDSSEQLLNEEPLGDDCMRS